MENKLVTVVSNFHGTDTAKVSRRLRDGSKKEFDYCLLAIKKYNMYMGGNDLACFCCAVSGCSQKSPKWWHQIFWGLLVRTVANSFVVSRTIIHENMTMLTYCIHVCSLVTPAKPQCVGCSISNTTVSTLGCYWVINVSGKGRCEVCSQHKIESRTHSKCSTCGVFVCCNEKKIALLFLMKFSRLSFKDTMMLGVLNLAEYL